MTIIVVIYPINIAIVLVIRRIKDRLGTNFGKFQQYIGGKF